VLLQPLDQAALLEAGDGLADGSGAEARVVLDLGDGIGERFLVAGASLALVAAQHQQDFELGAVEVANVTDDRGRDLYIARLGRGGPERGIGMRMHKDLIGCSGPAL